MNQHKSGSSALVLAILLTLFLIGGGFWLLARIAPGLVLSVSNSSGSSTNQPLNPQRTTRITVLGDTFSGYSTFRNAAFQEALTDVGIELHYEDEFDQAARANRLTQGNADLILTTLDQFLQQQPQGRIVGLIDRTVGADAVLLNTPQYANLISLQDLAQVVQQSKASGQPLGIAYAGDTPSEYLALVLDTRFEAFNLADFTVNSVADASEAWALLQDPSQNIAIAVLWEPFVSQARQQGYTVVLSSQDAPGAIVDVVVASDRLLNSRPDVVSEFLEAYYRRIDANVRDSSQLQAQIAEDGNLSASDAAAIIDGIEFFTAIEAQTWMTDGTLERRIGSTAAVLALSGRINDVPQDMAGLFNEQFIIQAANNTQTLIDLVQADNPELAERLMGEQRAVTAIAPDLNADQIQAAPDIGNLEVRGEVSFGVGSAQLTSAGQQTLTQLAQEINEFNVQTVAVRVIGHTSRTGSADINQQLSQERAQVVVNYLREQGIQHNIVAEGKGFSEPLVNIPPEDARNQRTEIRLVRVSSNAALAPAPAPSQPTSQATSQTPNNTASANLTSANLSVMNVPLNSAANVNYGELQSLLANQDWKAADELTVNLRIQAAGRSTQGWIDPESMAQFPCADLQTLDHLWMTASNGRFGFTPQYQHWQHSKGLQTQMQWDNLVAFGTALGWYDNENWSDRANLSFVADAPTGHLPYTPAYAIDSPGSLGGWVALFDRVETCLS